MPHRYSLRTRELAPGSSTPSEKLSEKRDEKSGEKRGEKHGERRDEKSGEKRDMSKESTQPETRCRYRGSCRYALGYRGPPGSGGGRLEQKDRVICDAAALEEFCGQVLQHGYSGSKGGRGSRVHVRNSFCEDVKKGEVDMAAGDRVAVVFSPTFGCRKLRVLQAVGRDQSGFAVRFVRPQERTRGCFESGYGSFSLAVIRAPGTTKEDFEFEEVDDTAAEECHDYVQIEEEEEDEEDDEEVNQ